MYLIVELLALAVIVIALSAVCGFLTVYTFQNRTSLSALPRRLWHGFMELMYVHRTHK